MADNEEIIEEFDHLDLSIDLRNRHDLRKRMTAEMKEERRKKQAKEARKKIYKDSPTKFSESAKRSYAKRKQGIQTLENELKLLENLTQNSECDTDSISQIDIKDCYLDLNLNLRKRPDLLKLMTPEMKEERKKKQTMNYNRKSRSETSNKGGYISVRNRENILKKRVEELKKELSIDNNIILDEEYISKKKLENSLEI
jgi:hypothetical protein